MSANLKQKGKKALIWDIVGKLSNTGMGFILTIFLARLLEPSEFGLIAIVMVIIGIASVFFDGGLSSSLIQRKKLLPIHYTSVFYFNIVAAFLLTMLLYFNANRIAEFYQLPELVPVLQVMSISFIIGALSSVQQVLLRKKLNFALLTKIGITSSITSGVIGIILAMNGAGVWSLVAQYLIFGIVFNIFIWFTSDWKPDFSFSFKALKALWKFGLNLFIVTFLNAIFGRIDVMITGKLFSASIVGFYDRAKSLNQLVVSYSAGSLNAVLFPLLSSINKDKEHKQRTVLNIFKLLSFFLFLMIGTLYLVSQELITLLFSSKWLPSAEYLQIVLLSTFAAVYSALFVNVIVSSGKSKLFLQIDLIKKCILSINLFIGFSYGLKQYLYGYILASILMLILDMFFAVKEIKHSIRIYLKIMITQILIAVISVKIVSLVFIDFTFHYILLMFLKSLIFVIIYSIISWSIKTQAWQLASIEIKTLLTRKV